jgi:hypothetical protein
MAKSKATVAAIAALSITGCAGGLSRVDVVKAPDAPMVITGVSGRTVSVSVYDAGTNSLIEYDGPVRIDSSLEGWTISKFDWETFIRSREVGGAGQE